MSASSHRPTPYQENCAGPTNWQSNLSAPTPTAMPSYQFYFWDFSSLLFTIHENLVTFVSFTLRIPRENVSQCDSHTIYSCVIIALTFWYYLVTFVHLFLKRPESPDKPYMSPSDIKRHRKHQQRIANLLEERGTQGFYTLPPELVDMIVDTVSESIFDVDKTLRAMAITCRAFLPRARFHLCYRYGLWMTWSDLSSIVRCYLLSPDIASSVVTLHFLGSSFSGREDMPLFIPNQVLSTLGQFTGVHRLHLSSLNWGDPLSTKARDVLMGTFTGVRDLDLSSCKFEDIHEFATFMHSFPQLEELRLCHVSSQRWICPCSNHPGRKKDIVSHYRAISPPPQTLRKFHVILTDDHPGNIGDIAHWYSCLPTGLSNLKKLMYWPCTFKAGEYDHSPLFRAAGLALKSCTLKWDARLRQKRDVPFSTMLFHEIPHLKRLHINFGEGFKLHRSIQDPYRHDPSWDEETQWLPEVIDNISSQQLADLTLTFDYHLVAEDVIFILTFLHLLELDEVLAHSRFSSTKLLIRCTIIKVKGEEYVVQEEQRLLELCVMASMPRATQRGVLSFNLHTYESEPRVADRKSVV